MESESQVHHRGSFVGKIQNHDILTFKDIWMKDMTRDQADQIAILLNDRNKLARQYTADDVLPDAGNYHVELLDEVVIGCVEIKKMQWYQWELCHLAVAEAHCRKGIGAKLIRLAETVARDGGASLVQCTIRVGNHDSEKVFRKSGYREACCFYYSVTDRYVSVWQKAVATPW